MSPAEEQRIGELTIASVADSIARQLQAPSPEVRLSPDTMLKQLRHHPELTAREYGRLPDLVRSGEATFDADRRTVTFMQRLEGRWYKAVVKRTATALYLQTFHRLRETDRQRALRRAARGGAPHPAGAGNPTSRSVSGRGNVLRPGE